MSRCGRGFQRSLEQCYTQCPTVHRGGCGERAVLLPVLWPQISRNGFYFFRPLALHPQRTLCVWRAFSALKMAALSIPLSGSGRVFLDALNCFKVLIFLFQPLYSRINFTLYQLSCSFWQVRRSKLTIKFVLES